MNILFKTFILCVLSVFITQITTAQITKNNKTENSKLEKVKQSVTNSDSTLIRLNTTTPQHEESIITEKDSTNQRHIDSLLAIKRVNTCDSFVVDRFLNRLDTAIFLSDFQEFTDKKIHPRSRKYYRLIKDIHKLDSLIKVLDISINNIHEVNKSIKEMVNITTPLLKTMNDKIAADLKTAEKALSEAGKTIDSIQNKEMLMERRALSDIQWKYYEKLVQKFNKLINITTNLKKQK